MQPRAWILVATIAASACGGDSGTEPGYEIIAGTYGAVVQGVSEEVALSSTVTFTLLQSGGNVSGTWSIVGTLTEGSTTINMSGGGTLTGAIASGDNPSVNITIRVPGCSGYQAPFSGVYDASNQRITLTGAIEIFAPSSCSVALSYQGTFIVNRSAASF